MIQGVIFDMDGLMFDTERIWATLWEPALAGLGLSYKEGLDEAARGTAGDSMRAVLRRFYGPDCDPDRIIEALHEQGVIAFQAPPPKKPGLDEILAWLEQRHIPMVVASSSRMASIRHHLDSWGLTLLQRPSSAGSSSSAQAGPGDLRTGPPRCWAPHDLPWCWRTASGDARRGRRRFCDRDGAGPCPAGRRMRRLYAARCASLHEVRRNAGRGRL